MQRMKVKKNRELVLLKMHRFGKSPRAHAKIKRIIRMVN